MAYYLYEDKGWPEIVWEEEREAFVGHRYIGSYEDTEELIRVFDEMTSRAVRRAEALRAEASAPVARPFGLVLREVLQNLAGMLAGKSSL